MGFLGGGAVRTHCCSVVLLMVLLAAPALAAGKNCVSERVEHKETFHSPSLKFRPGDVKNKYFSIESPGGHFATIDFDAELVYENGESVPLSDVYLHHWTMSEFAVPMSNTKLVGKELEKMVSMNPAHVYHGGAGVLDGQTILTQTWAKGGETRHLNSTIPAPYGLESGAVPDGYRAQWVLNVHGIDTRGVVHRMRCTECRCDLFSGGNRTNLPDGYQGGLQCCVDESRCLMRDDFNGNDETLERTIRLKYTWTYITFDECVVPLSQVYIDVTAVNGHGGSVEYTVEGHCKPEDFHKPECVDVRETVLEARYSSDLVYAVSHLHAYALDSTLWGEDGRVICHSPPIYGHGKAAGDEKGYVVGIRHCNPSFSSVNGLGTIKKGEKLRYQVKYTKVDGPHTGVMGFLFMKVAEEAEIVTPVAVPVTGNRKIIY